MCISFWVDIATIASGVAAAVALGISAWQLYGERRERKYEVARAISAWLTGEFEDGGVGAAYDGFSAEIVVSNSSDSPIYDVVVSVVSLIDAGPPKEGEKLDSARFPYAHVAIVPPGCWRLMVPSPNTCMGMRVALEIGFTDDASIHWIRRASGELVEITEPPSRYYGAYCPIDYQAPERVS